MWGKELSTFSGNWELTVFIANSRCEISSIPASEIGRLPYESVSAKGNSANSSCSCHQEHCFEQAGMVLLDSRACTCAKPPTWESLSFESPFLSTAFWSVVVAVVIQSHGQQ